MRILLLLLLCGSLWAGPSWLPCPRIIVDEVIVVEVFDENGWYTLVYWVDHNDYMWIAGSRWGKNAAIENMRDKITLTLDSPHLLEQYLEETKDEVANR